MPFPFLIVGAVAGGVSLGMTAHSALKKRKWRKIHDERRAEVLVIQKEASRKYDKLLQAGEGLGHTRVHASLTLEEAATYLRAVAKQLNLQSLPKIPNDVLEEWSSLRTEIIRSLGLGLGGAAVAGATATAGSALYTAAGLFGVASTGTRIANLSGVAANSARLAWIGGGAVAAGGGGVALGSTILNVLSKANIVTAPLGLALSFWSEKQAHDYEKRVTAELKELTEAEIKLRRKSTAMPKAMLRIEEIQGSIENTNQGLKELLAKAKALPSPTVNPLDIEDGTVEPDLHLAQQIYLTAKALRELLEQPGIPENIRRILEE